MQNLYKRTITNMVLGREEDLFTLVHLEAWCGFLTEGMVFFSFMFSNKGMI